MQFEGGFCSKLVNHHLGSLNSKKFWHLMINFSKFSLHICELLKGERSAAALPEAWECDALGVPEAPARLPLA